jgi:diguanylate cyclase (GGDEF)-like protein
VSCYAEVTPSSLAKADQPTDAAELQRTVDQLAAFHDIGRALTSTLALPEVLSLGMQKVSELLMPSHGTLLLYREETRKLSFEVIVGEGVESVPVRELTVDLNEGIAGMVFTSGEAKLVPNVQQDPAVLQRFRASHFPPSSALAVPLKSRGKALGVVELLKGPGDDPFTAPDLAVLTGVADYLAIAIENARNFERVQELTITDEHTGLFNSRHLRAVLETEVTRAKRFTHPLSLLFLDLDRFKQVNDTYGHLVGSATLREVGEVLTSGVRQVDPVFRFGGDEFALVLLETDSTAATRIAKRLCQAIRERTFLTRQGLAIQLSASIGVASLPQHAATSTALLEAADAAMYRSKAEGRNAVSMAAGPETQSA